MREKFKVVKFNNGKYGVINITNSRFVLDNPYSCWSDYQEIVEKDLGLTLDYCRKTPNSSLFFRFKFFAKRLAKKLNKINEEQNKKLEYEVL